MTKQVKIYSTLTCPICRRTKKFLDENKISFRDFNVGIDAVAREDMIKKSGQMGVPVIDIDGEIIVGFDEPKLRDKLGLPRS